MTVRCFKVTSAKANLMIYLFNEVIYMFRIIEHLKLKMKARNKYSRQHKLALFLMHASRLQEILDNLTNDTSRSK